MELGLSNRRALVCASSRGLGKACAISLAREGVAVTVNGRNAQSLESAVAAIREISGAPVTSVVADITTEQGRRDVLAACPAPDILVNNAGGPPAGNFRDWNRDDWIAALDANMLTAIELIKATVDGMIERRFGRIVNITSAAVKAPNALLGLSNGARAGLTGFVAGLAREVAAHNVTINALLPGGHDTDRLHAMTKAAADKAGTSFEQEWQRRAAMIPAGRYGTAEDFGDACAFFCSAQAGFITGQNLVIDGGAYPGTL